MKEGLPNNIEAEKALLGSLFWSHEALQKACEELSRDVFYLDSNGKIFDAIQTLYNKKETLNVNTLTTELVNRNWLNEVGGVTYINEIINSVATGANIEYYINTVLDKYTLRRMIEVATNIVKVASDNEASASIVTENAEKDILNVAKTRKTSAFRSVQDVLIKAQEDLDTLAKNKGRVTGLTTGLIDLDNLTEGLHPTQLVIIAARPAVGKTAFALNVALNAALKADAKVLIFSLEMAKEQLSQRLLSMEARVESQKMSTGDVDMSDWDKMSAALDSFNKMSIYIDDTPGIKLMEIKNKCRRMKAETGLDMIILDYLQLMEGEKRSDNRQQEITSLSRGMKLLAREMECPVIVLSQLSRAPDQRENHRPVLSDLRESGAIEQDADVVLFLYRDEVYNEETEKPGICEVIVAKHRNGPIGTVEVGWQGKYTRFVNLQR